MLVGAGLEEDRSLTAEQTLDPIRNEEQRQRKDNRADTGSIQGLKVKQDTRDIQGKGKKGQLGRDGTKHGGTKKERRKGRKQGRDGNRGQPGIEPRSEGVQTGQTRKGRSKTQNGREPGGS